MHSFKWVVAFFVALVIVVGVPVFQFLRPAPPITLASTGKLTDAVLGAPPKLDWPKDGQAALVAVGVGDMGCSGRQTSKPIASVTKVMTAYLILKKHPLASGEDGPTVTVRKSDYQTYLSDKAKGESVLAVRVGEELTERQALEGLLLPSGNNVATMLAKWAAGSESEFVVWMNQMAHELGMTQTHYADASGFSPESVSTAANQVKLFAKAMDIKAFRNVVGEAQATLPVAGRVFNVDYRLGHGGIIGGKTGSTAEAGGCFAFASEKHIGKQNVLIVGVILGQEASTQIPSSLMTALDEGVTLSMEAQAALHEVRVIAAGEPVAALHAPWMSPHVVRPVQSLTVIGWNGMRLASKLTEPHRLTRRIAAGEPVGALTIVAGRQVKHTSLTTDVTMAGPSYLWRLKRL